MKELKIKEGYRILYFKREWKPPYGRCNRKLKRIEIFLPKWLPKSISRIPILNHELGHAYGIDGCWKPWCLMFESCKFMEMAAKPFQAFKGLRFCKSCRKHLESEGAFDA